ITASEDRNFKYKVSTLAAELPAGDCRMKAGSFLMFINNGKARFSTEIKSSDTGDNWKHRFIVLDKNGRELFPIRGKTFLGTYGWLVKEIYDHDWVNWDEPFTFSMDHWSNMSSVDWFCDC